MQEWSKRGAFAIGVIVVVGITLSGCSSDSSNKADGATTDKTDKTTTTTTAHESDSAPTEGSVNLKITGTTPLLITGTKTSCTTSGGPDGTDKVESFGITGADYPELGPDGGIGITPVGGSVTEQEVKVNINGTQTAAFGAGITFSADGRTATVNTDLQTPGDPKAGSINGTITCP